MSSFGNAESSLSMSAPATAGAMRRPNRDLAPVAGLLAATAVSAAVWAVPIVVWLLLR